MADRLVGEPSGFTPPTDGPDDLGEDFAVEIAWFRRASRGALGVAAILTRN